MAIVTILDELLDKMLKFDFNAAMNQVLANKSMQDFIIRLNTRDQLFLKGEDSTGVKLSAIGGGYAPKTIKIALEEKNNTFTYLDVTVSKEVGGSPILYDDGDFFATFRIKLGKDFLEIVADGKKEDGKDLLVEWGPNVLGLTEENLQILIDEIRPQFIEIVREALVNLV